MNVRIKDIAKKANVSIATVSLVLNNKPGVNEETRKRVLRIAEEINYPIQKSKFFPQTKRGTIRFLKIIKHGHILNRDHDVFIADYIRGLDQETRSLGYSLEINVFNTSSIRELANSFNDTEFNGLVVLGTELNEDDIKQFQDIIHKPIVFIDTIYDFIPFDFVDMNNSESVFRAITILIKNNHKEIGFITSSVEAQNFRLREKAFRDVLNYYKIPVNENYIFAVDSTYQGAYRDMRKILESGEKLPPGIFAINDIIAYGCIKAIKEKGYVIPKDVSIVGFDDLPMSSVIEPPLTTIKVSKRRIGQMAIRLLYERIKSNNTFPPVKLTISGEMIERESVKKLK